MLCTFISIQYLGQRWRPLSASATQAAQTNKILNADECPSCDLMQAATLPEQTQTQTQEGEDAQAVIAAKCTPTCANACSGAVATA